MVEKRQQQHNMNTKIRMESHLNNFIALHSGEQFVIEVARGSFVT